MRCLRRLAAAAMCAFGTTGCATMTAGSQIEHGVDFVQYRTYDWGPADALPTGDPRLDQDPFFQDHLQGAVEEELAVRGFERSTSATPGLLIHYHASINHRIDVDPMDRAHGYSMTRTARLG
jgi:hypothetical protein